MPATLSNSFLTLAADAVFPSTGTFARLLLLSGTLATGLGFTANSTTNELTTSSSHSLVTGSRVRVASTTTVPTPLSAATDYYAIVTTTTTLKLATTLANALAATEIDLTDTGTGTLTLNEQELTCADSITVLVNKELPATGGYARIAIANIDAAGSTGEKPPVVLTITNSGGSNIDYKHHLVAYGANTTVGSATGITAYALATEASTQTTVPGQTRAITVNMRATV